MSLAGTVELPTLTFPLAAVSQLMSLDLHEAPYVAALRVTTAHAWQHLEPMSLTFDRGR